MSHKIDRTGESKIVNNGLTATIIAYRSCHDIDVEFSDGRICKHLNYSHFKKGDISGTNRFYSIVKDKREGQSKIMNCGLTGIVTKYNNSDDVDITLENGDVINTRWQCFERGEILPLNVPKNYTQKIRAKEKYEGMTGIASNGMKMTITQYRSLNDIDVLFEDGYSCKSRVAMFLSGSISNPNFSIYQHKGSIHNGETAYNSQGLLMTILAYNSWREITVQFEDGTIVKSTYGQFKKRKIENPNQKRIRKKNRIGEENIATCGLKMTVCKYNLSSNIDVQFEDGTIVKSDFTSFRHGNISHPTLKATGKGSFAGFETKFVTYIKDIEQTYYSCTCLKCGLKDILTPQDMITHEKSHIE